MRPLELSDEQLAHYQDQGYVLLGRVMDDATIDMLRHEEKRLRPANIGEQLTLFTSQVCNYSEPVREFCTRGPHLSLVEQLVGPNLVFWFNQFVTKFPDANSGKSEFPWHQDNGYAAVEPATNVTIWFALDDTDEHNGCVWVLPESHRQGLLEHKAVSTESWQLTLPVTGDGVPARLKAGEAIAFTGLTLHRSKLNYSDRSRRGFFTEYADAAAVFYRPQDANPTRRPVVSIPDSWLVRGQLPWPGRTPSLTY